MFAWVHVLHEALVNPENQTELVCSVCQLLAWLFRLSGQAIVCIWEARVVNVGKGRVGAGLSTLNILVVRP